MPVGAQDSIENPHLRGSSALKSYILLGYMSGGDWEVRVGTMSTMKGGDWEVRVGTMSAMKGGNWEVRVGTCPQ